ncbi:Hypothetical predicted protein, partial [Paramuricea clavata]
DSNESNSDDSKLPKTPSLSNSVESDDDDGEVDFGINLALSDRLEGMSADLLMPARVDNKDNDFFRNSDSSMEALKQLNLKEKEKKKNDIKSETQLNTKKETKLPEPKSTEQLNISNESVESEDESMKKRLRKERKETITKLKQELENEQEREEGKLRAEYATKMKELQIKIREEHLEEEAHLQEGMEDAIRKLKSEIKQQQAEEEEKLKNKKNEELEEFRTKLKNERRKEEDSVNEQSKNEMKKLKEKYKSEEEAEERILDKQHKQKIEELREKLEKEKDCALEEMQQQHQYEIQQMKSELEEQHEKAIHELKDELEQNHESDVENVKNEIKSKQENQQLKVLQKDHENEIKMAREKHEKDLTLLKSEHESKIYKAKQEFKEMEMKQQFELSERLEREKKNLEDLDELEIGKLREEFEQRRSTQIAEHKKLESEVETMVNDLNERKAAVENELNTIKDQERQIATRKEEMQKEFSSVDRERQNLSINTEGSEALRRENQKLEENIAKQEGDIESLKRIKQEMQKEIDALNEVKRILQQDISDLERRLSTMKHQSEVHGKIPARRTKHDKQETSKSSDELSSNDENDIEKEKDERLQLEDLNDKTLTPGIQEQALASTDQNGVASHSDDDEKFLPKQSSSRKQAWAESHIPDSALELEFLKSQTKMKRKQSLSKPKTESMWKRFEDEENAIVRAKEFLRNRSSTLHKKKGHLASTRSTARDGRNRKLSRDLEPSKLDEMKHALDQEEAEVTEALYHMSAGENLLRQKEERLKMLENTFANDLSSTSADSDSDIGHESRQPSYYERHYQRQNPRRSHADRRPEKASNGYQNGYDRRKRRLDDHEPRSLNPETNEHLMSSLKDINNELSRMWSYMTSVYQRAEKPTNDLRPPPSINR